MSNVSGKSNGSKKDSSVRSHIVTSLVWLVFSLFAGWFGWNALRAGQSYIGTGLGVLLVALPISIAYCIRSARLAWKQWQRDHSKARESK